MSDTIVAQITVGHDTVYRDGVVTVQRVWVEIGHQRYLFDTFPAARGFAASIGAAIEAQRKIAEKT